MTLKDYNETYAARMRDKQYLDAYLEACLAEGPEAFYVGLRRAVQARDSGFTWLSAQTRMGRESLYRALSADGNPSFRTILKVMRALGADVNILAHMGTETQAVIPTDLASRRKRRPVQGAEARNAPQETAAVY